MRKIITAGLAALTVAGSMAAVTTAEAGPYRGYRGGYHHHRGGVSTGTAVGLGILGVAIGAAVASQPRYPAPAPYYPPAPPPVSYYDGYGGGSYQTGYGDGYYGGGYGYDRYERCRTTSVYDNYRRAYIERRVCD